MYNNPTRSPFDPESPTGYNVWTGETLDYNIVADRMLTDYEGLDKWFKPEVTMKLNIKPIEGLSYSQTLGYENRQWELHQFRSRYHRDEVTNNRGGWAKLEFSKTEHLTSEGYFTYLKEFKGGHSLNAVAGYSYFEKNGENFNAENYDFGVEGLKYWDLGAGSYLTDGKAAMGSGKNITERLFDCMLVPTTLTMTNIWFLPQSVMRDHQSLPPRTVGVTSGRCPEVGCICRGVHEGV